MTERPPLPPFDAGTATLKVRRAEDAWNGRDPEAVKELWTFAGNRIAVRFAYEWRDDSGSWFRSYGNENWEFDERGLMRRRIASINDLPIADSDRLFRWPAGQRPADHPGLSDLGL